MFHTVGNCEISAQRFAWFEANVWGRTESGTMQDATQSGRAWLVADGTRYGSEFFGPETAEQAAALATYWHPELEGAEVEVWRIGPGSVTGCTYLSGRVTVIAHSGWVRPE